ncbi:hypothetical protein L1887_34291 [Cichorium endivia]|nr:hypothetical protein L1887_34291 [Cichorium endivia]
MKAMMPVRGEDRKHTYSKVAAFPVRPLEKKKELMFNSLDDGATKVIVGVCVQTTTINLQTMASYHNSIVDRVCVCVLASEGYGDQDAS